MYLHCYLGGCHDKMADRSNLEGRAYSGAHTVHRGREAGVAGVRGCRSGSRGRECWFLAPSPFLSQSATLSMEWCCLPSGSVFLPQFLLANALPNVPRDASSRCFSIRSGVCERLLPQSCNLEGGLMSSASAPFSLPLPSGWEFP